MLAGYRDEEIAQAAAAVKQAQAAYDYAQNFYAPAGAVEKPHHFRQRPGKCALLPRPGAGTLKSAQDKLSQYHTGNRPQDIAQAKASLEQAQAAAGAGRAGSARYHAYRPV
jgi:HlyD family secretion protein